MIVRWGTQFHDRLDALTDRLASMSHLADEAIEIATDAVVHADRPLAERVFDLNEQVEASRGPCKDQALALLAFAGPGRPGSTPGHHRCPSGSRSESNGRPGATRR